MRIIRLWPLLVIALAAPLPAAASAGAWTEAAGGAASDDSREGGPGGGNGTGDRQPAVAAGRELPGEVVLLDAEAAFLAEVSGLGFRVIEQRPLGMLGITVTRLSVPGHLTAAGAEVLLRERYPDLRAASNALYRLQAAPQFPDAAAVEAAISRPR